MGRTYSQQVYTRLGYDHHVPDSLVTDHCLLDKTRLERLGSTRISYSDEDPDLAFLLIKVDLELPSSYGVGLVQVMQLLHFEIDRPAIATTMPPPPPPPTHTHTSPRATRTIFLPSPDDHHHPDAEAFLLALLIVVGLVAFPCILVFAYKRFMSSRRVDSHDDDVPPERRPLLPEHVRRRAAAEQEAAWRSLVQFGDASGPRALQSPLGRNNGRTRSYSNATSIPGSQSQSAQVVQTAGM